MMEQKIVETPQFVAEKKKRRKRRQRIQLGIFLAVVALVTLVLLFMFTNISYVSKVTVNDTVLNSKDKILKKANVTKSDRIYSIDPGEIASNIEYLDGIKSVTVKRHFPNKVDIHVDEYQLVGVVPDGSAFHPVLENGQILHRVDFSTPGDAPIINNFSKKELNQLVKVLSETKNAIANQISEINFVPNEQASARIQIFMKDGIEVIGDLRTISDKLNYYPSMVKNIKRDQNGNIIKPGMIDLEVGAVFIPYESKKAEARRLELESEMKAKDSKEKKEVEQAVQDLQKQLKDVKQTKTTE
ncbi:cell division protein FtsQ/DivIB [Macrococcus capreoli]|uniref:cell division protein FtsQ/DivIB n=1 Tax=Macrococcus capreoli TaxID=2982690 RepID=UPI0021D5820E|nr:FtsQ-type POTRA domain-containing protein [Macrococcus sp. TMW 2.2395]MCU7558041.1 FtsQ-type POTRA domain-containing protein [Macrococcus sp. TMW 2.2395]